MNMSCDQLRALLEEHALDALRDNGEARTHAAECEECFALVEALGEVDRALAELPAIDAPDALVERVLSSPKTPAPVVKPRRRIARWIYGSGAIAATVLVGLFSSTMVMRDAPSAAKRGEMVAQSAPEKDTIVLDGRKVDLPVGGHAVTLQTEQMEAEKQDVDTGLIQPRTPPERPAPGYFAALPPAHTGAKESTEGDEARSKKKLEEKAVDKAPEAEPVHLGVLNKGEVAFAEGNAERQRDHGRYDEQVPRSQVGRGPENGWIPSNAKNEGADRGGAAASFLSLRDVTEGLAFQPGEGYWQNTYVPGDPAFRLLAAKLAGDGIEDRARPYAQPFDAPHGAALGVTMASDRAAVDGRTRVLLQIGLKGAPEYGRRRPTMNLALVVDAAGTPDIETAKAIRSVVLSFAHAREAGDRIALFAAGRPGALLVEPKRFDYGTAAVTMQALLGDRPGDGETLTPTEALRRAIELVAGAEDESAPLGASAVVLIEARTLGIETERLADLAHQSAVAGIVVSTVGVGDGGSLPELERIALAGQGNRRLLASAAEAEQLVDRELSAVSRVVARAVRLRIRLAPGVQLIDVLGSRRLDTMEADRVREAEKSIDLRLSKHLGIDSDRGEDEDGIQIVIPSYYANDEHPILLDVVVPGPGPVADVQVRYKDLVYLKNGVARARLELRRGRTDRGPLQLSVLKNLVARQMSDDLYTASAGMRAGDVASAKSRVAESTALIADLQRAIPSFSQDPELARDADMLARYQAALVGPDPALAESLEFASMAKILPPPLPSQR